MRSVLIGCLLLAACGGSGTGASGGGAVAARPAGPEPLVTGPEAAKAAVGKTVRVEGTALNGKLGPVVTANGLVVYCFGKQEWSAGQLGEPVAVKGTLEQTDEFRSEEDAAGAQAAGTGGRDYVIRDCSIEDR